MHKNTKRNSKFYSLKLLPNLTKETLNKCTSSGILLSAQVNDVSSSEQTRRTV